MNFGSYELLPRAAQNTLQEVFLLTIVALIRKKSVH